MIGRARSRIFCRICRYHIQPRPQRASCAPVSSTTRPACALHRWQSTPQTRSFSQSLTRPSSGHQKHAEQENQHSQDEATDADAEAERAVQEAVIEQLEQELGKSFEQATQGDQIAAEFSAQDKDRTQAESAETPGDDEVESGESLVTALRHTDASPDAIVRVARQLYGDALPRGMLRDEEYALYVRLYGQPSEQEESGSEAADDGAVAASQLLSVDGEEIDFRRHDHALAVNNKHRLESGAGSVSKDFASPEVSDIAELLDGDIVEEDGYDDDDDIDDDRDLSAPERSHPLTALGKFGTNPRTVFLSRNGFVGPVERIMSGYSNKHLKEVCERSFGGPGLPDSPLTPRSGKLRQQVPIPLDVNQNTIGEMEANAFLAAVMPPTYAAIMSVLVETRKRLGPTWLTRLLAREGGARVLDAGAGGVGIVVWREIVQAHWASLHSSDTQKTRPPATKSVVLTGSDGLRHRAAQMLENTTFIPRLPDYVHARDAPTLADGRPAQQRKQFDVIIAPHALFSLKEDWMRKQYVQNLWTMLSDEGGVLILIEKGIPRGFEAIAGAREMLLDRCIAIPEGQTTYYSQSHEQQLANNDEVHKKERAMIVAPCTNHERCPMYTVPGLSRGRRDICSFQQRYIRPPFLQRILGAKDRNHDDVDFSYLSVMKGDDLRTKEASSWNHIVDPSSAPTHPDPSQLHESRRSLADESEEGFEYVDYAVNEDGTESEPTSSAGQLPTFQQMPRIVLPPLKRRGHVSIDLCTPAGQIERWTIPRSFSKQAYRDARKSKWGDLWALGAKTHTARNLRLGSPEKEVIGGDGEIVRGKGRGRKERLRIQALEELERREEEKMDDLMEQRDMMAALEEELEAETGLPRDGDRGGASPVASDKPMNNRERKAAKRALRDAKRAAKPGRGTDPAADLTFKPRIRPSSDKDTTEEGDLAHEHELSEWQAEFDEVSRLSGSRARGLAHSKVGRSSKAAKQFQKYASR